MDLHLGRRYILEHETKGILVALPYDRDEKCHFSWSINRSDEKALLFTLPEARRNLTLASMPEGTYIFNLDTKEVTT